MRDVRNTSPVVDRRDAEQIAEQIRHALTQRIPDLHPSQISGALIAVFARYCEILIERINHAPHKALLTFVNLLGLSPHPPQPAQVPLTFSVNTKCIEVVRIPKGTQVAGPSAHEGGPPVVFETEADLYASSLALVAIMVRCPQQDRYGDLNSLAGSVATKGQSLFEATTQTVHCLYLGHLQFLSAPCQELHLIVETSGSQAGPMPGLSLQWEVWNGKEWIPVIPERDETNGLMCSGHLVFRSLPKSLPKSVCNKTTAWLRGRLLTPLVMKNTSTAHIDRMTLQIRHRLDTVGVSHAFVNQLPLDLSKECYLFGEKPKFGDVLYLAQPQVLGQSGGRVTVHIELLNPLGGGAQGTIREIAPSDDLKIQWDISAGMGWTGLGVSQARRMSENTSTGFKDETQALTKSGTVSFLIPRDVDQQPVNGMKAVWVRARILAGDYGKEALYTPRDKGYELKPSTFGPPIATSLSISLESSSDEVQPEFVITSNDSSYEDVTSSLQEGSDGFTPFAPMKDDAPALYLGYVAPNKGILLSGYPLNIYFHCDNGLSNDQSLALSRPHTTFVWEYWNGQNWSRLSVVDRTKSFSQPEVVQFTIPSDWQAATDSDLDSPLYWIRVQTQDPSLSPHVCCRGVLTHTVMASHATTLKDELLGNTTGIPKQSFRTLRTPVLPGQVLEVCEPVVSGVADRKRVDDKKWVEWKAVDNFLSSGGQDLHYTIDRRTGNIAFGDGKRGAVPPPGLDVRMRQYQIGGGPDGNVAAGSLVQPRTTIPYMTKAINLVPACGGADSEALEVFVARALRTLRHHNRAVAYEDYEDLALAASSLVAQARCIPSYDLADDPERQHKRSGIVSLIILPRDPSDKPTPDAALLNSVQGYLQKLAPAGIDICVVPPRYGPIDVDVDVVVQPEVVPAIVERTILNDLRRFLHPVTGGPRGQGWQLGEYPPSSSLHSRIMKVPGVHHIRQLRFDVPTGHFQVCSGANHHIHATTRSVVTG